MGPLFNLLRCVFLRLRDAGPACEQSETPETPPAGRPGLARLYSDSDVARQAEGAESNKDMHTWMADEDARREELFRRPVKSPSSNRRHRTPGAHIGFQMAQQSTQQVFCCGACGVQPLLLTKPMCPVRLPGAHSVLIPRPFVPSLLQANGSCAPRIS